MNTTKTLFHSKLKAILRDKWKTTVSSEWFQEGLVWAFSSFMEGKPNGDNVQGAISFRNALLDLPEDEAEQTDFPSPGLNHDLDSPTKEKNQEKEKAHA